MGAVEDPIAQIAEQRSQPDATHQTATVAHRIGTINTAPVGQGRTVKHHGAGNVGAIRADQRRCPAGLTIADDRRRFGFGVTAIHLF
ncbi:MAG: hypothetical protein N839_0012845 [Desulfofustis sp. PB-SRB1]|nr:hypothetical protein [Desulfofustis sp. PB-SRB1]